LIKRTRRVSARQETEKNSKSLVFLWRLMK
jgi:hypothetical protein